MNKTVQYKIENNIVTLTFQSGLPGYINLQKIDNIQMKIEQYCSNKLPQRYNNYVGTKISHRFNEFLNHIET